MKQKFQTVTVEKTGLSVKCQRVSCGHKWIYTGRRNFAWCPSCHTTVTIGPFKGKEKVEEGTG